MRMGVPAKPTLKLAQARKLGELLGGRAGRYRLVCEICSLFPGSRHDAGWTAGMLDVAGAPTPIGFIAKGVGGLQVGRVVEIEGYWDQHSGYGTQFVVDACRRSELPRAGKALMRYLAANVPSLAERRSEALVAVFGDEVLARLLGDPDCVKRVFPGKVGEHVALGVRAWARDLGSERWCVDVAPKLMVAADITYPMARRIVSYFNSAEVADIFARRDPYRLLDVPDLGWTSADVIARALGVASDAEERLEAALRWAMQAQQRAGHTATTREQLITTAGPLVPGHEAGLTGALGRSVLYCELIEDGPRLYTPEAIQTEWHITNLLAELLSRQYALTADQALRVSAVVRRNRLTTEQGGAVRMALQHGVAVLTGGPGTGKTYTLRSVIAAAQAIGLSVRITTPTGKAAARAAEMAKLAATTVHKLLGGSPGSLSDRCDLGVGLLILEEASMLDAEVMAWLAKNITPTDSFCLFIVGDDNQLPSVGHGKVLTDLLASGVVPATRLTQLQRQAVDSRIAVQAHRLLRRQSLLPGNTHDWTYVELPESAAAAQEIVLRAVQRVVREERTSLLRHDQPFDPCRDLQVLTPRRSRDLGVDALNERLRGVLNGRGTEGPWIASGQRVRVHDRVICIQNDYSIGTDGLMNGEQGIVEAIDGDTLRLLLDDGRRIVTRGVQNYNLSLAFATTVHRSQGSEYPVVVVVYHTSHYPLVDLRLLYTAITRAKARVVLCADPRALVMTTEGVGMVARCTGLTERLREAAARRNAAVA